MGTAHLGSSGGPSQGLGSRWCTVPPYRDEGLDARRGIRLASHDPAHAWVIGHGCGGPGEGRKGAR
jgi:hypothetical protein